jgi:dihydrofolate reductase
MRKLKLQTQVSIDGYMSGSNGEMDWMAFPWDDELIKYTAALTNPVDCILLGRKLAEGFIPHWASKPEGEDPVFAEKLNQTKKVVFSTTLEKSKWPNTILATTNIVNEVEKLKTEQGKDMIAYGGGQFVSSLIQNNLIDDLHLYVNPTAIGSGMRVFASRTPLTLIKATQFNCGITVLNYGKK